MTDEEHRTDRRTPDDISVKVVPHERRRNWHTPEDCAQMLSTKAQLEEGSARMERIEVQVCAVAAQQFASDENQQRMEKKLDETCASTEELLQIIRAGKGFFKVIGWLATAVKWAAGLAIPLIGLWLAIKGDIK